MLTKEQKRNWIERLRDPKSQQLRGQYAEMNFNGDGYAVTADDIINNTVPMCCLTHLIGAVCDRERVEYMIKNKALSSAQLVVEQSTYVRLNDNQRLSLNEIAHYVERHEPTAD